MVEVPLLIFPLHLAPRSRVGGRNAGVNRALLQRTVKYRVPWLNEGSEPQDWIAEGGGRSLRVLEDGSGFADSADAAV